METALVFVGLLLLLLILGVPVGFALLITGTAGILLFDLASPTFIPQQVFGSINSFTMLAIPFFLLAGNIMLKGKLARYLLDFMSGATRSIYGGKSIGLTFSGAIFGAITGSSVACTAAVGSVGYPELRRENYEEGFSNALISTVGALGIMLPPSLVFILIGAVTGVSIPMLFLAGIVPGLIETGSIALLAYFIARKYQYGIIGKMATLKEWGKSFLQAFWALLMPAIILGGIYGGVFTPTEAAAAAAAYAFLAVLFIYRAIGFKDLLRILNESAQSTAMVLFVVVGATVYGYAATYARVPIYLSEAIAAADMGPYMFLTITMLFFILLGCFLDGISLVLITAPILYPILPHVGVNPIHFGVVLCTCIEIAQITPPVGLNMYVMSGISKTPVEKILRNIPPFFLVRLATVLLITYVPAISLGLVNLVN